MLAAVWVWGLPSVMVVVAVAVGDASAGAAAAVAAAPLLLPLLLLPLLPLLLLLLLLLLRLLLLLLLLRLPYLLQPLLLQYCFCCPAHRKPSADALPPPLRYRRLLNSRRRRPHPHTLALFLTSFFQLAEQLGPYETYEGSPASEGLLQYDMWGVTPSDRWDWAGLKVGHPLLSMCLCVFVSKSFFFFPGLVRDWVGFP